MKFVKIFGVRLFEYTHINNYVNMQGNYAYIYT